MRSRSKNLAATVLLVALFGIPAVHLARGNGKLEEDLEAMKGTATQAVGEQDLGDRSRDSREMTVGQLFRGSPVPDDARGMLRFLILATQNGNSIDRLKIEYHLKRLSLEELRLLRAQLRETPGYEKDRLEELISKAAIAWFQSKTAASDFRDGSIAGRKNRALVFGSLVKGVAEKDLDRTVDLFEAETRREEIKEASKSMAPLAIQQAVESGDEEALRKVIDAGIFDGFMGGKGNPLFT